MRRSLSALLLVLGLPWSSPAASDLDRIITLPSQPAMTKAPRVAVQSPGEPFARQIPFWRAVQDVLQSSDVALGANISGNAATATALAANGTNCSSGSFAAGVDASGNAEGCTAPGSGGIGTVTSVAVAGNDGLSVSGSPITSSGTITLDLSGSTPSRCARWDGSGNLVASSGDCTAGDTDTDTTCNDAGVSCLFAGSASEGGPATTALALNANPTACTGTQKVTDIAADGTLTCGADIDTDTDTTCNDVSVSCLFAGSASEGGPATSALTSTNADNLTLDPSDCGSNTFATSIDRQADLTCASITDAAVPNSITVDNATNADAVDIAAESTDTASFPLIADAAGSGTSQTPRTDNGLTYNASTNALGATSLTLSAMTNGRLALVGSGGLLTDDAGILYDAATDALTAGIYWQATNNSGGLYGRPTSGTNDYRLFVNSSNEWELRQNVGGVVNAVYRFGGAAFYPTALEELGTASAGWGGIYLDDGGGDTARIVAPALSSDITLTLPAATGTLATLAGTETFNNKTCEQGVVFRAGSNSSGTGRPLVCVHDSSGSAGNNPGGGDTDGLSHTLAASSLGQDGARLVISASFQCDDDGANNQRFRILVGGVTVFDSGSSSTLDSGTGPLHWVEVTLVRTSSASGSAYVKWSRNDGTVVSQMVASVSPASGWSVAQTIKGVVNGVTAAKTKHISLAVDVIQES